MTIHILQLYAAFAFDKSIFLFIIPVSSSLPLLIYLISIHPRFSSSLLAPALIISTQCDTSVNVCVFVLFMYVCMRVCVKLPSLMSPSELPWYRPHCDDAASNADWHTHTHTHTHTYTHNSSSLKSVNRVCTCRVRDNSPPRFQTPLIIYREDFPKARSLLGQTLRHQADEASNDTETHLSDIQAICFIVPLFLWVSN